MTDPERERLALLMEEMGEALHMIGKTLRHGFESTHPDGGPTNRASLCKELSHVAWAIDFCLECGDVAENLFDYHKAAKAFNVQKYLHCRHEKTKRVDCKP